MPVPSIFPLAVSKTEPVLVLLAFTRAFTVTAPVPEFVTATDVTPVTAPAMVMPFPEVLSATVLPETPL